jgi:hypothetical protein
MNAFESSGKRTQNFQDLYDVFLTVKPTSVEAESQFSSATFFSDQASLPNE